MMNVFIKKNTYLNAKYGFLFKNFWIVFEKMRNTYKKMVNIIGFSLK